MALKMLRLLVMARLLDVPAFASYSAGLLLSSTFCMVSCLGLQSLLQREWPVYVLRGQSRRAVVRAVQCGALTVASALLIAPTAWVAPPVGIMTPHLMMVGVLHGVTQQMFLIASTQSRSEGNTLGYSLQQLLRSGFAVIGGVVAAVWSGEPLVVLLVEALVSGLLAANLLRGAVAQAGMVWPAAVRLALRRAGSVPWRAALTSMAVLLAAFAMLNADRWMAAKMLVPAAFAQYSFAAIVLAVAQALQALINASVYPLLARRFAEQGATAVFRICLRAWLAVAALGLVLVVPVVVVSRYVIDTWYPNYADAAAVVPLLTLVSVLRVSDFFSSYLMITAHEGRMLLVNIVTVLCGIAAWLAWLEPWSGALPTLLHVALLAAGLSLLGSGLAAVTSWATQRHAGAAD